MGRGWYRLWALVILGLGLALLVYNLSGPPYEVGGMAALWPAVLLGLGLPFFARWARGLQPPTFACERGESAAAELRVRAGTADVRVEAFAGASQLLVGRFPSPDGPRLERTGEVARLVMDQRAAAPLMEGPWTAALNKGLPWTLDLRASAGALTLDLRDCQVPCLDLESLAGPVDLTLPASGQGEMRLRLGLGDLTLRVPNGVGFKVRFQGGPLAALKLNGRKLVRVASDEWATSGYATAEAHYALTVAMGTGDLNLAG